MDVVIGTSSEDVTRASLVMAARKRGPAPAVAMAAIARARTPDPRHLLAARYGVDAEQLLLLDKMVDGLGVRSMPRESAVLINSDMALRLIFDLFDLIDCYFFRGRLSIFICFLSRFESILWTLEFLRSIAFLS